MSKQEYLEKLEACLRHYLLKEEIEDILCDYAEYFEEGRRQSKTDSEIAAKMGDPEMVAKELIEENHQNKASFANQVRAKTYEAGEKVKHAASKSSGAFSTIGKVLLILIALPFAAMAVMLLGMVLLTFVMVLAALFMVPAATACITLAGLIITPFAFSVGYASLGFGCLFATLSNAGLTMTISGLLIMLLKRLFGFIRRLLGRRQNRCPDFTQPDEQPTAPSGGDVDDEKENDETECSTSFE